MRTLYLTVSHKPTKVIFEKAKHIHSIKVNKAVLSLNYKNLTEKAPIKSASSKVEFEPGFLTFKGLQKGFEKFGAQLSLEEETQKAIIKAPSSSAISISDNLKDLLGSDTKTFQAGSDTTLANQCDMLNGLKYFVLRCDEVCGYLNQRVDEKFRSVSTDILGLMEIKSFVFIGGAQYHDQNDFTAKRLNDETFFNELTFSLSGNNSKDVGEVFLEIVLCYGPK